TNPRKAALVRFLMVDALGCHESNSNQSDTDSSSTETRTDDGAEQAVDCDEPLNSDESDTDSTSTDTSADHAAEQAVLSVDCDGRKSDDSDTESTSSETSTDAILTVDSKGPNSDASDTQRKSIETRKDYVAGQALLSVLPKLTSLKDLRVKFDRWDEDLESILQLVFFDTDRSQRHTLTCVVGISGLYKGLYTLNCAFSFATIGLISKKS
ncbi:hypothetical protein H0H93_004762, partial [Arthromyces matolae]